MRYHFLCFIVYQLTFSWQFLIPVVLHLQNLHTIHYYPWCTADIIKVCRYKTTTETILQSFYAVSQMYSHLSVSYRAISIFRRLYCTGLVAVHKLAWERSVHFRILCREGVMGCLYRHCSNITVINAAFHPFQSRKVLKLPLVLLLMHQPVWPNCGSSQARKLLTETIINYPISLSWNRNCIRAFNV